MLTIIKKEDVIIDEGFFEPLPERQLGRLTSSIKECGLLNPIVVRKEGDKYRIVDGRNRFRVLCALGVEEIPAYIINVEYTEDTVYQYDVELCRRHLSDEEIERKWVHERQNYFNTIKKAIKRKVLSTLGVEETETIKDFLDSLTLKQLLELQKQLQSVSAFPKFLNALAKHTLSQIKSVAEINGSREEIERISNQYYQKQIEEFQNQLKEKEETLLELEMKLNEIMQEKKQLEEQLDTIRKATQKKLEELAKKFAEEKDKRIKELEQEIIKLRAQQAPSEALKKLADEFEEKYKKTVAEIKEKYQKEEAEYRAKINELQTTILNLQKILQNERESREKLEKDIQFINAEKERIRERFNNLYEMYKEVTSEKALLNQLKALRGQLKFVLQVAYSLDSFNQDYISQIKHTWEEVEGIYNELKDYMKKKIIPSERPSQN